MNTTSASPADTPPGAAPARRNVLIWDAPVRVMHWLLVACFAGAWLTAESEAGRLVHVTLGYTMAGLVAFRLVWGFAGTRHARFASFVKGPKAVAAYLRGFAGVTPMPGASPLPAGHNPAGAWAIVALLGAVIAVTATGWLADAGGVGEVIEEGHEVVATAMLALVGLHVAGVAVSSWRHRENLVGAMVDGRQAAPPAEGIGRARWGIAALLLATVLGYWTLQALTAPQAPPAGAGGTSDVGTGGTGVGRDRDHDKDD
jgi:cytochrome b